MSIEVLSGWFGSGAYLLSVFPQIIKTYKSKRGNDLSWVTIGLTIFSSINWIIYGIYLVKYPIIISSGISCIITIMLGILKYKYNRVDIIL